MTLDPRINVVRDGLADERLRGRVEAVRFVTGRQAEIRVPVADLRRRAAGDAPLETQALFGEAVAVFDEPGEGWSLVQLGLDGYVGWMESEALAAPSREADARVSALRTLVFSGPDIKSAPLFGLSMGSLLRTAGSAEDHNASYACLAPAGAVVRQHLAAADDRQPDFVTVAERFLGVPYLWGGRSSLGIDCSGLLQLCASMTGLSLPRDADMQETATTPVEASAPRRRSDLVFWKGHVGMMLDGTRLLHANAHHMATAVEPLDEAVARIAAKGSPVTSIRRLLSASA